MDIFITNIDEKTIHEYSSYIPYLYADKIVLTWK